MRSAVVEVGVTMFALWLLGSADDVAAGDCGLSCVVAGDGVLAFVVAGDGVLVFGAAGDGVLVFVVAGDGVLVFGAAGDGVLVLMCTLRVMMVWSPSLVVGVGAMLVTAQRPFAVRWAFMVVSVLYRTRPSCWVKMIPRGGHDCEGGGRCGLCVHWAVAWRVRGRCRCGWT
jgi:hypothetical protein